MSMEVLAMGIAFLYVMVILALVVDSLSDLRPSYIVPKALSRAVEKMEIVVGAAILVVVGFVVAIYVLVLTGDFVSVALYWLTNMVHRLTR
jgi:hypothetical protein